MRFTTAGPRLAILGVACASALSGASGALAATTRSCRPVVNPYAGTRFEGVNLSHIRATGVSCPTARRVARRAHRKALGIPVAAGPIRRFTWNGWHVTGDLRPAHDVYVARRGTDRVRWRF
jgi:hypothetical protein